MSASEFIEKLDSISKHRRDPVGRVVQYDGIIRACVQSAALGGLQVTATFLDRKQPEERRRLCKLLGGILDHKSKPSDSHYLNVVEHCRGSLAGRFSEDICEGMNEAVQIAREWVDQRNQHAHGFVSVESANADIAALDAHRIRKLIEGLAPLIPQHGPDGWQVTIGSIVVPTQLAPAVGVLESVNPTSEGWVFNFIAADPEKNQPIVRTVDDDVDIFRLWRNEPAEPRTIDLPGGCKLVLSVPPPPQTFLARTKELERLDDWLNSTYQTCIICGDGGLGKTALALKFVDNIEKRVTKRTSVSTASPPKLVVFLSAKTTQWRHRGLRKLTDATTRIDALLRRLCGHVIGICGDDYGTKKLEKCKGPGLLTLLSELRTRACLAPRDILVVLDNAETIAERNGPKAEIETLTRMLHQLSEQVKLLITTRDREHAMYNQVCAVRIPLDRLSEDEMFGLVRALLLEHRIIVPRKARQYARELNGTPFLAHALVQKMRHGLGAEDALSALKRDTKAELGEFLFETSWSSLTADMQTAVMAFAPLGTSIAKQFMAKICQQLEFFYSQFEGEAASAYLLFDRQDGGNWELDPFALEFVGKKYKEVDKATRERIDHACSLVSVAPDSPSEDSDVATLYAREAYRYGVSKRASEAWTSGQYDAAEKLFDQALRFDPQNGRLFERYARFLLDRSRPREAAEALDRAGRCEVVDSGRMHFTLAELHFAEGRFKLALDSLEAAQAGGCVPAACTARARDVLDAWAGVVVRSAERILARVPARWNLEGCRGSLSELRGFAADLRVVRQRLWQLVEPSFLSEKKSRIKDHPERPALDDQEWISAEVAQSGPNAKICAHIEHIDRTIGRSQDFEQTISSRKEFLESATPDASQRRHRTGAKRLMN